MDSVQVRKAVFVKESYTTLGIEPRIYSNLGRSGNHSMYIWVKKNKISKVPGEMLRFAFVDTFCQNVIIYAFCRILMKYCDLRALSHFGKTSRFTHISRQEI